MDNHTVYSMIRKYGEKHKTNGRITDAVVTCTACKKEIHLNNEEDLENTLFVMTKRKTPIFIHASCVDDVWNTRI